MKTINVILLDMFLLLSAGQLHAQRDRVVLPYKPVSAFKGDTAAYLEYNYTIRYEQYAGKTIGEIIKELEYPVLYVINEGMEFTPKRDTKLTAISLIIRQMDTEHNPGKDYYIIVRLENPPLLWENDEYLSGIGDFFGLIRPKPKFTADMYNLIKDWKVLGTSFNPYLVRDPEILKKRKEIEKEYEKAGRLGAEQWEKLRKDNKLDE
ncbi:MAG: hypothetical protein LBN23_07355 [Paludibacter sp.]|jgi:hypothetical protein|nr:hypothetical protein [Paludibacter sp.]